MAINEGIMNIIGKVVVGVFLLFISYLSCLYISYINETILIGSGYGFNISTTKADTFKRAKEQFKNEHVYQIYPEDEYGAGVFKKLSFDDKDELILFKKDSWAIYYDGNVWDSIELTFENDKLLSIYRRRQNFELP